eukprot:COSAG05_NODE_1139_length_5741_cov_7.808401_3_plen_84_part_00
MDWLELDKPGRKPKKYFFVAMSDQASLQGKRGKLFDLRGQVGYYKEQTVHPTAPSPGPPARMSARHTSASLHLRRILIVVASR